MLNNFRVLSVILISFALAVTGCAKKQPATETAPSATTAEQAEPAAAPAAPAAEAPTPAEPIAAAPAEAPPATEPAPAPTAAAAPAKPINGEAIAQGICMACHQAGMNGAPKFANKIAWAPRIAQGRDKLYANVIKGLRGMPPRGGNPTLSDDELKAAVDFMVKVAGGYKE